MRGSGLKKKAKVQVKKKKTAIKPAKKARPKARAAAKGVKPPKAAKKAGRSTLPKKAVPARKEGAVSRRLPPPDLATATGEYEEIVAHIAEGRLEEGRIKESKFDIGVPRNAHAVPSQEIPLEYGKNQVTLLVVDPRFAFTYWEVRQDAFNKSSHRLGHNAKLTLRFYDITNTRDPETSPSWDVEVFDRLGNWYLRLEHPEQRLCLDIGMKGVSGEFLSFARSNVMRLPSASLAAPGPIKWMVVSPAGDKLISDAEEYTDADLALLKKILGPYFFDLLMRGRFASIAGSSIEAIFYDVSALRAGESPSSRLPWAAH